MRQTQEGRKCELLMQQNRKQISLSMTELNRSYAGIARKGAEQLCLFLL